MSLFLFPAKLNKKTFLQTTRSNAGRVKFLNYLKHIFEFLFRNFYVLRKGNVIGYGIKVTAKISVLVDVSDKERSNKLLSFSNIFQNKLLEKMLVERLRCRIGHFYPIVVLGSIVYFKAIVWNFIVVVCTVVIVKRIVIFTSVFVIRILLAIVAFLFVSKNIAVVFNYAIAVIVVAFTAIVESWIFLNLVLDAFFELQSIQFQQLYHLNLLRSQLLRKFLFERCLEHSQNF